jgi:hypothetical protein
LHLLWLRLLNWLLLSLSQLVTLRLILLPTWRMLVLRVRRGFGSPLPLGVLLFVAAGLLAWRFKLDEPHPKSCGLDAVQIVDAEEFLEVSVHVLHAERPQDLELVAHALHHLVHCGGRQNDLALAGEEGRGILHAHDELPGSRHGCGDYLAGRSWRAAGLAPAKTATGDYCRKG